MTRWIGRAVRFGDHAAIWRAVRPPRPAAGAGWFVTRFLDAGCIVVRRWGPSWARSRRLLGREVGAWILAVVWLGIPLAIAVSAGRSLFL
jgi:hypothetical protein